MYAVILAVVLIAYIVWALLYSLFVSGAGFVDTLTGKYMYLVVALLTAIFVLLVAKYWGFIVSRAGRNVRFFGGRKTSAVCVKTTPKKSGNKSKR